MENLLEDNEICAKIGQRAKRLRLHKNYSQQEVADQAGISVNAIKSVEKGRATLLNYVKFLRVLGCLESLESFLPDSDISPIQYIKLEAKKRCRATGRRGKK